MAVRRRELADIAQGEVKSAQDAGAERRKAATREQVSRF
jgi:hypothetical protein